jgi:hypothetical protein
MPDERLRTACVGRAQVDFIGWYRPNAVDEEWLPDECAAGSPWAPTLTFCERFTDPKYESWWPSDLWSGDKRKRRSGVLAQVLHWRPARIRGGATADAEPEDDGPLGRARR